MDEPIPIPVMRCPRCGAVFDGATRVRQGGPPDDGPHVNDMTICTYCAGLLIFTGDPLTLRRMTKADLDRLSMQEALYVAAMQNHIATTSAREHALRN